MRYFACLLVVSGALFGALLTTGCAQRRPARVPLGSRPLGTIPRDRVEPIADELLVGLGVGPKVRADALERLRSIRDDPEVARLIASRGLNGVAAYRYGGGGFVVEGGGGEGLAHFAGGRDRAPFELEAASVGANIGGGNRYGVMLIIGLRHEARFSDNYHLSNFGAAAGDAGWTVHVGQAINGAHQLRMITTGVGFGATAGGGKIVLTWRR